MENLYIPKKQYYLLTLKKYYLALGEKIIVISIFLEI